MMLSRDSELWDLTKKIYADLYLAGVENAWELAAKFATRFGKPKFYVSYDRAYRVCCALANRQELLEIPSLQNFWRDFYNKVDYLTLHSDISIAKAVEIVLEHCRADRFHLSDDYVKRHIYEAKKNAKKNGLYK